MRIILLCLVLVSANVNAGLIDRGNGLIYDDVLDITWLQDASQGGFNSFLGAAAWADALVFEGFDDWRPPSMSVAGGLPTGSAASIVDCRTATELACRDNELGYMYYYNLTPAGDTPPTDFGTDLRGNQGLIENIHFFAYRSGTDVPLHGGGFAWDFGFGFGTQEQPGVKGDLLAVWAVRPGDVLAVPEPMTGVLLALGLAGLGFARKRLH